MRKSARILTVGTRGDGSPIFCCRLFGARADEETRGPCAGAGGTDLQPGNAGQPQRRQDRRT